MSRADYLVISEALRREISRLPRRAAQAVANAAREEQA